MSLKKCPLCRQPAEGAPIGEERIGIDCAHCGHLDVERLALERLVTSERSLAEVFASRARQLPPGSQLVIQIRRAPVRHWAKTYERVVATVQDRKPPGEPGS